MLSDISPEIWFYEIRPKGMIGSISSLVEKIYENNFSVFLHCHDEAIIELIDEALWTHSPHSFLPHSCLANSYSHKQDILIGAKYESALDFDFYMSLSQQDWPNANRFKRMMFMFDGSDTDHRQWARQAWLKFKEDGFLMQFWKQAESGKWERHLI